MLDRVRDWINNNSAVATVVIIAVLLAALGSLVWRGVPPRVKASQVWFYDATADKLFTAKSTELAPITSPDGHEAVRAHFYSCGPCTAEARFLGYYEKFSPETKKQIEANLEALIFQPGPVPGRFYSTDAQMWHEDGSKQAEQIKAAPHVKCPDGAANACLPQDEQ